MTHRRRLWVTFQYVLSWLHAMQARNTLCNFLFWSVTSVCLSVCLSVCMKERKRELFLYEFSCLSGTRLYHQYLDLSRRFHRWRLLVLLKWTLNFVFSTWLLLAKTGTAVPSIPSEELDKTIAVITSKILSRTRGKVRLVESNMHNNCAEFVTLCLNLNLNPASSFNAFLQMKGWRRVGFLSNDLDLQSILLPQ